MSASQALPAYSEPGARGSAEIEIHKSRFIATVRKAVSAEEARLFVKEERGLYPGARHVVFAFLVGPPASETAGMSDDGEPKGTAGRPVLEVLKGSGLRNALVTVTRYFGGVKLGTGGLVRAYSEACRKALEAVPRAEARQETPYRLTLPYEHFESVKRELLARGCRVTDEAFAEEASFVARVAGENAEAVLAAARDLCRGKCRAEKVFE